MSKSTVEARKLNGDIYTSAIIHQFLCGLLRHIRETIQAVLTFQQARQSVSSHAGKAGFPFHKLHSDGIGVQVQQTELITIMGEVKVLTSGVMGVSSLSRMQPSLFWGRRSA